MNYKKCELCSKNNAQYTVIGLDLNRSEEVVFRSYICKNEFEKYIENMCKNELINAVEVRNFKEDSVITSLVDVIFKSESNKFVISERIRKSLSQLV